MQDSERETELQQQIFKSEKISEHELIRFENNFSKDFDEYTLVVNQIASENICLLEKLISLKSILHDIKNSLEWQIEHNRENNETNKIPRQYSQQSQKDSYGAQYSYYTVKKLQVPDEMDYRRVANKLKIFVSKVIQDNSSSIRHNFINYTNQILNDLKLDSIYGSHSEKFLMRNKYLIEIKRKFNISTRSEVLLYRHHLTENLSETNPAIFYVNFYNQRLLFFKQLPLSFNSNLLYCPLLFQLDPHVLKIQKNSELITISHWYLDQLNKQNAQWMKQTLSIVINKLDKQFGKSKKNIYFYAKCEIHKLGNKINQNATVSQLRKIRGFVYIRMIFNWLKNAFYNGKDQEDSDQNNITIYLGNEISVLLTTSQIQSSKENTDRERPRIAQDFLGYFSESKMAKRNEKNVQQIKKNIETHFRSILKSLELQDQAKAAEKNNQQESKQLYYPQAGSGLQGFYKYGYVNGVKIKL